MKEQSISNIPDREILDNFLSIDWYSPGESKTIKFGDSTIRVRMVGRKGRRVRIRVEAHVDHALESKHTEKSIGQNKS